MFFLFGFPFFFLIPLFFAIFALRAGSSFFRSFRRGQYGRFPDGRSYDDFILGGYADNGTGRNTGASMEAEIFKLAYKLKGRLTLSDIIIETGLGVHEAEELIQGMVDNSRVRMEVDDRGMVIYEFPEIMERFRTQE